MATEESKRIGSIDALRGIALAGIVICHMVENYIASRAPESLNEAIHVGTIDYVIDGFIGIFLRGKFIALFSFLFGLSFFIQMDSGAKKGVRFGGRFLWRLILLFVIGFIHSLFYRGDILTIYAILGVFLIPFYRLNNKWVLGIAALLFIGIGRYIVFYLTQGNSIWGGLNTGMEINSPKLLAYYDILKNGSIWEVFKTNAIEGHLDKMNFQFGFFGRGYFTFAFFLVGLYIGRSGFFQHFRERRKFVRQVLIWSTVGLLVSLAITAAAFMSMGENISMDNWPAMVGLSGMGMANASMTLIYIALFIIMYRKAKLEKWLYKFAPYGRMALTNYFLQSVIGTYILFGWGLGLIEELRNLYTFAIALAVILIQMWLSKVWLDHFKYGPLEWLWRSLTFFRVFPMKK